MSLDDKINAPERTIFDERQNAFRLRYGVEALLIFAIAAVICCVSMDFFYKWAESTSGAVVLIGCLSLIWFLVRCTVKGCMAAAAGKKAQKTSIILTTAGAVLQSIRFSSQMGSEGFFLKDGMLSNDFLFWVCFILLLVCGIFSLCVIRSEEKRNGKEE